MTDDGGRRSEKDSRAESLLADYAAGALSEPFAVLVAAHRQMRGEGRVGAMPLSPIDRSPRLTAAPSNQVWDETGVIMPLALRSYVSRQQETPGTLEWRLFLPGIERCWISRVNGTQAYLLRCRPGSAVPPHTHTGREAALVLQGGFHDARGRYGVGDLAVADHTVAHRPVADREGICIIFVVLEGPVKLTGLVGRLIQRIFRM
ncbi:MAG TPA: cupin domain-containing protein [Xanthobacteraceae bacterium]|nr:cupin domain-containing protein [Xanthobacteraceae bacterium]